MDDLSIHEVAKVTTRLSLDGPFTWRSIRVTKADGDEFEITLFGKKENLLIIETTERGVL
jgi:hypothetical protein